MDRRQLERQNRRFANTPGVSKHNQQRGFIPAFKDPQSGRIELARKENGEVAAMHLIAGLPDAWVAEVDQNGAITRLKDDIVAGFVRDGEFFTRDQAIQACKD